MLDRFTYYPCKASAGELMRKLFGALLIALIVCAIGTTMVVAMEDVRVAGSTTVLPLAEGGAEVFNAEQSDYRVTVTGGGTGVGMKNIAEGNSEIAMASREVTDEEREKFGDKFQENLIGYDGIVIAVSREIYDAGVTSLSKEQVEEIYAGEIDNWEELDGPDEEILVIGREQGSGTRDTFNEEIMGDKSAETPGVSTVAGSNAEIKTALTGSDQAIGYLGYSYVQDDSVGTISLDGILPTEETIKDGSYELARELYFYTYDEATAGAQSFIDFMLGSKGRDVATEYGFIPL
ncbi:phosphate abc transporter [hydrocarbon metagenome]|jgi:phosphate transport system substrate-binding protein|nr:MAG: Phosphate ABC transporter, periplasmic phosphate-binding protein PstS [Methanothrix sp.]